MGCAAQTLKPLSWLLLYTLHHLQLTAEHWVALQSGWISFTSAPQLLKICWKGGPHAGYTAGCSYFPALWKRQNQHVLQARLW